MAHVQIGKNGMVVGVYSGPQPGNDAVREIPDNDPRLATFLLSRNDGNGQQSLSAQRAASLGH